MHKTGITSTIIEESHKDPTLKMAKTVLQSLSDSDLKKFISELRAMESTIKQCRDALADIAVWDDDLEDEWGDQGSRADDALETIDSLNY